MSSEIAEDFSPMIRVYKDGRVERLLGTDTVPPSFDEKTGVQSKDVAISSETGLWARLYIPKALISNPKKLPLLVYYHGGAFCIESAQSPTYHNYLNSLVSEANVVVVSVDYRRAPEDHLPIAYEDSWAALKWVALHSGRAKGPEEWLNSYTNLSRVYIAGDSAGGNIAHRMAMMFGANKIKGIDRLSGIVLFNPYFWGSKPVGNETTDVDRRAFATALWKFLNPTTSGDDDPVMNPAMDPNLSRLGCSRVLVSVAELDMLQARDLYYAKVLGESGWVGDLEVMEFKGEDHVFHLLDPSCDNAVALMKRVVAFLNDGSN